MRQYCDSRKNFFGDNWSSFLRTRCRSINLHCQSTERDSEHWRGNLGESASGPLPFVIYWLLMEGCCSSPVVVFHWSWFLDRQPWDRKTKTDATGLAVKERKRYLSVRNKFFDTSAGGACFIQPDLNCRCCDYPSFPTVFHFKCSSNWLILSSSSFISPMMCQCFDAVGCAAGRASGL